MDAILIAYQGVSDEYVNGNYKRKPYFTRYDDNLNVVKSCDKCPYCVDEISVSRFICNKANREIGYASQQTFPEWCPLTNIRRI